MPRFPLSEWRAEQFRLTAFSVPGTTTGLPDWWERVTGLTPDERSSNPKKNSAVIAGAFDPGKLILRLESERIDWLLVPEDIDLEVIASHPQPPFVGLLTETLSSFSSIAERWLSASDLPELGRVAFGVVLSHTELDQRAAYLRLQDYLPVRVDPDSSDFLYQVNLPVPSQTGITGLRINRLSKWSVAAMQVFAVRISAGAATPQPVPKPVFALRLELDINTRPDFEGPLPRERLLDLYRELTTRGREIAELGIPSP